MYKGMSIGIKCQSFELFQYVPVDQIQKCNKQMHLQPENTTTEHESMFQKSSPNPAIAIAIIFQTQINLL